MTKTFSKEKIEEQETLNLKILSKLNPKCNSISDRPVGNFINLIEWTENNFTDYLQDNKNINRFIHNKIIMDGQFYQFAKENNIKITPLYKDAIISWNTINNYEKFFVQGVFLIQSKNCEFIQASLYHKSNEDEVCFFILCSNNNYNEYIKLRNNYEQWISFRDRNNLTIRVAGDEDIQYNENNSWEKLFLPKDIKDSIKSTVENFLLSKDFYMDNNIPWKRGILLFGEPGNGKTSIIKTIISNYNFKAVTVNANASYEIIKEAFSYAESQSPAFLYFEDLDSLLGSKGESAGFLNLLDGVSSTNGLLIMATANDISKLHNNITDRPSRFDRKYHIPLPNKKMSKLYLKSLFGTQLSSSKLEELSKYATKNKLSYVYLKELYISSMYNALSNDRKNPSMSDIDNALQQIINDKNIIKKEINTNNYFR